MNTDQCRALKQLKEMYPKKEHQALELSFKNFLVTEAVKYNNPIDLAEAYIKWSDRNDQS